MARVLHVPLTVILTLVGSGGCGGGSDTGRDGEAAAETGSQAVFWQSLVDLCGEASAGRATVAPEGDTVVAGKDLVMHIRECGARAIRIPFLVGENRSRTWVLTRTDSSIALAHDHRHEDGTSESNTGYGGETVVPGTAQRQAFPADRPAGELEHPDGTNVWTMELDPGGTFVYSLHRMGSDRRYRVEFDLSETVPTPPPPWGS